MPECTHCTCTHIPWLYVRVCSIVCSDKNIGVLVQVTCGGGNRDTFDNYACTCACTCNIIAIYHIMWPWRMRGKRVNLFQEHVCTCMYVCEEASTVVVILSLHVLWEGACVHQSRCINIYPYSSYFCALYFDSGVHALYVWTQVCGSSYDDFIHVKYCNVPSYICGNP